MKYTTNRRKFIQSTAIACSSLPLSRIVQATSTTNQSLKDRLFKTLKIGMVGEGSTLTEKFKAAKTAGFGAIELNAPGINTMEIKRSLIAGYRWTEAFAVPIGKSATQTKIRSPHEALADLKMSSKLKLLEENGSARGRPWKRWTRR